MFVRCIAIAFATALLVVLADAPAAAQAAPRQLLNKTVRVSFTLTNTLRRPDGRMVTGGGNVQQLFYVSSAGRIFVKRIAGGRSGEAGPGEARTNDGTARSASFQGGKLVAIANRGGGAGRTVVSFDPSFSSCTVDVQYGKPEGQAVTRRGPRGGMLELISTSYSGQSCSIADGNQVAN